MTFTLSMQCPYKARLSTVCALDAVIVFIAIDLSTVFTENGSTWTEEIHRITPKAMRCDLQSRDPLEDKQTTVVDWRSHRAKYLSPDEYDRSNKLPVYETVPGFGISKSAPHPQVLPGTLATAGAVNTPTPMVIMLLTLPTVSPRCNRNAETRQAYRESSKGGQTLQNTPNNGEMEEPENDMTKVLTYRSNPGTSTVIASSQWGCYKLKVQGSAHIPQHSSVLAHQYALWYDFGGAIRPTRSQSRLTKSLGRIDTPQVRI
ncbi:hypothetical protein CHU98_g6741 [Xylaria longipes]|nr:hypothetical protein CHU98_g6741 [Xylaria longipes]